MQTLEELTKNWKRFVFTSIAAASLWLSATNYLFRNDNLVENNAQEQSVVNNITYSYHGTDGFEIQADFGDTFYTYTFDGSCRDETHRFSQGNILHVRNGSRMLSMFDFNCDYFIDHLSTGTGTCSASADSSSEMCNQRTYDEANRIFVEGLKKIRLDEFSHKYYQQRFSNPELPEDQTKRLLDGFNSKTTQ